MMGRQTADQARLFYEFHLDDRVPKNHLLRRIDVFGTVALAASKPALELAGEAPPLGRIAATLGASLDAGVG